MNGELIIVSAPSGAGKTTLVRTVCEQDKRVTVSISHTTRRKRPEETAGLSYHFVDVPTFEQMVARGMFLEHAKVFDNYYGTSKMWVDEKLGSGVDVILEIDWQGAQQVKKSRPETRGIFILPPSFQALEQRLSRRGEEQANINRRMQDARLELSHYHEYDFVLVNGELEQAVNDLGSIIRAIRCDYRLKKPDLDGFVGRLMAQAADIE